MRDGRRWVVVSPFGVFGGRRRGWGYDPRYDRGYGRQNSSCLRDLLLLDTGCCLAEAIGGNCLLRLGWLLPTLLHSVASPCGGPGSRAQRALLTAISSYRRDVSARRTKAVCPYTPSCSTYATEAIARHGALRGTWRAVRRLLRCRPGTAGGFDPLDATMP